MRIDRCVCYNQTFAALRRTAEEGGCRSLAALQAAAPFGLRCGLCLPYARRMLRTGETVFHRVLTDRDEPPEEAP